MIDIHTMANPWEVLDKIRELAEKQGISLLKLCDAAGISRDTYHSWNIKRRKPGLASVILLTNALRKMEEPDENHPAA